MRRGSGSRRRGTSPRQTNGCARALPAPAERASAWAASALALIVALPARADAPASAPRGRLAGSLDDLQGLMAAEGLDGWLLSDDASAADGVAGALVALPASAGVTRRWFYFVPRHGDPVALTATDDAALFAATPGRHLTYSSWRERDAALRKLFAGATRVAMDTTAQGAIPALSRADAGTVELVRALGVDVVSSADLAATALARWSDSQRATYYVAAHHLAMIKDEALAFVSDHLRRGDPVTEGDVVALVQRDLTVRGLISESPPVVAAGVHTAIAGYRTPPSGGAPIRSGDLVLVSLSGRLAPGAPGNGSEPYPVYATLTWMAYAGAKVPDDLAHDFAVVRLARDKAVQVVADRFARGRPPHGYEVDDAARAILAAAGLGDAFTTPTGHSLDTNLRGRGPDLDDYYSHDVRLLQRGMGFAVAPGVYFPGRYGLRSEIDLFVGAGGPEIATPQQATITTLLP